MIPKVIHYCWFGHTPKPKLFYKCYKSWKKKCPEYEIVEWNESNFDISSCPLYVRQAYEAQKWAFVTDFVRLKIIYENGGIYLDTDVEVRKNLTSLLKYDAYFGFENNCFIATGLGFGAIKKSKIIEELIKDYETIPFVLNDGEYDETPCPERNTPHFKKYGFEINGETQVKDNICVFSSEYLSPLSFETGKKHITQNTISIHWYSASWKTKEQLEYYKKTKSKERQEKRKDYIIHIPNRLIKKALGEEKYKKLKNMLKS